MNANDDVTFSSNPSPTEVYLHWVPAGYHTSNESILSKQSAIHNFMYQSPIDLYGHTMSWRYWFV